MALIPAQHVTLSQTALEMGTSVLIDSNAGGPEWDVDIWYYFGSGSGRISTAHALTWDFPAATLAPLIPNAPTAIGRITAYYYRYGILEGSSTLGFQADVSYSALPTIAWLTAVESPGTTSVATLVGEFVQGVSVVKSDFSGAVGVYGSTIISAKITIDGVDHVYPVPTGGLSSSTVVEYTLPILTHSGTLDIKATVVDSRGRIGTLTITPTVLAYAAPHITGFTVQRCSIDGTLNALGTYAKITTAGSVSSLMNSTERNLLTWTLYARPVGTTSWGTAIKTVTSGVSWASTDILGAGAYTITEAFEFRLDCIDRFKTTLSIFTVPTGVVTMSLSRDGVGVGKVWEQGALDVGGDIFQNGFKVSSMRGGQAGAFASNFALGAATVAVATATIVVPAGFTTAIVFSSAHVFVHNTSTTVADFLYVGSQIGTVGPAMTGAFIHSNEWGSSSGSSSRILTGLSGGTITVAAMAHTAGGSWTASSVNTASIDAIAIFYQ